MRFVNENGAEIEIVEVINGCVTFRIFQSNKVHTDVDCWLKDSFHKMLKENGYKLA